MTNKHTAGKFSQSKAFKNRAQRSSGHPYNGEIRALHKTRRHITVSQDLDARPNS